MNLALASESEPLRYTGREHLEYWTKKLNNSSFVYVIQGKQGGPIKVGTARNVEKRMRGLQTGYPYELRLLFVVPGDNKLEWNLQKRIWSSRLSGEWFDGDEIPAFLAFVGDLADRIKAAHNPRSGIAPDWRDFGKWKRPYSRKGAPEIENTRDLTKMPPPVGAEEAKRRLAAHWTRTTYGQHLGHDS